MIKRTTALTVFALLAMMVLGACGLLQEPEEASEPIQAIPLEVESDEKEEVAQEEPADEPADEEGQEDEHQEEDADHSEEDADDSDSDSDDSDSDAAADLRIFSIEPALSEVRFELDEDLRGERKTVVGITDQVSGELAINPDDLSSAQAGIILVNARTLLTDNDFRNRAVQNEILDTGDFEFIRFEPTSIEGLPASVEVGETVNFSIIGDLTIRDIVQEAVFEVEATLTAEDTITGSAMAVVSRADYDLNIPSVPNVANVEEDVELYINFTASS